MTRHFYILLLALALCVPVRASRHGQTLTGVSDGGGSNPLASLPAPSAFWRMEETGGSNRVDSTLGGMDLTVTGGAVLTGNAGKIGNQCDFSAQQNWLKRTDANNVLRVTGPFTAALWVKWHGFNVTNGTAGFMAAWDTSGKRSWFVGTVDSSSGTVDRFRFGTTSDGSTETDANETFQPVLNTYYFLVCRWDGATMTLTTNDGTKRTASTGTVFGGTGAGGTVSNFVIGSLLGTTGSAPACPIDEAGWWQGTALTDAQVTTLYHGGAGLTFYSGAWHTS